MTTTISTVYRAEVQVPSAVFEAFGSSQEYSARAAEIARRANVACSGQDSYAEVYEWAEDSARTCVENWAAEWEMYLAGLKRRLPPC